MKFFFLFLFGLILLPAVCLAEEPALAPLVHYDFADADDLGHDLYGVQPMANIRGVTQGVVSEGVYSAVFNGKNALAAIPLADRDVTDGLSAFTITLWGKHPKSQPAHSFLLPTGARTLHQPLPRTQDTQSSGLSAPDPSEQDGGSREPLRPGGSGPAALEPWPGQDGAA